MKRAALHSPLQTECYSVTIVRVARIVRRRVLAETSTRIPQATAVPAGLLFHRIANDRRRSRLEGVDEIDELGRLLECLQQVFVPVDSLCRVVPVHAYPETPTTLVWIAPEISVVQVGDKVFIATAHVVVLGRIKHCA